MRWMNLEPIVQSEVSQKEKDKYCISGWVSGKEPACQCRRNKRWGFDPWVGKFPWRTAWQPTPVSLPGVLHGQEPGRLQSAGSQRVRHDWSDLAAAAATHVYGFEKDGTDESICRAEAAVETDRQQTCAPCGKEMVGWIKRVAWKHIRYHMWNR